MLNLVLAVMSVAFASALLVGGIWYIDPDVPRVNTTRTRIQSGFAALAGGFNAYRVSTGRALPVGADWEDPGTDGWRDELASLITVPDPPTPALDWQYGIVSGRRFFCLEGSIDNVDWRGLEPALLRLPSRVVVVKHVDDPPGTARCGEVADDPGPPAGFPTPIAVTYWLEGCPAGGCS